MIDESEFLERAHLDRGTLEIWIRERPEQWFWLHRRWPD